jgi:hypothetical protein
MHQPWSALQRRALIHEMISGQTWAYASCPIKIFPLLKAKLPFRRDAASSQTATAGTEVRTSARHTASVDTPKRIKTGQN